MAAAPRRCRPQVQAGSRPWPGAYTPRPDGRRHWPPWAWPEGEVRAAGGVETKKFGAVAEQDAKGRVRAVQKPAERLGEQGQPLRRAPCKKHGVADAAKGDARIPAAQYDRLVVQHAHAALL